MGQSPRGTRWAGPLLVSRLVTTGSIVAATAGMRAGYRSTRLCVRRSPTLLRLAVDGVSDRAAAARSGLRDELLGLIREVTELSWHETRRALDELDARTRAEGSALTTVRRRRARVKP